MTPTSARANATRTPPIMNGMANGNVTCWKICHFVALNDRAASISDSVRRTQPDFGVDDDGKHRRQHDDRDFRVETEAEPRNEQWRQGDDGHRVHGRQHRGQHLLQHIALRQQQPNGDAEPDRDGEADGKSPGTSSTYAAKTRPTRISAAEADMTSVKGTRTRRFWMTVRARISHSYS